MTCPVCKGEKQVFIRAHNESGFVQCPHCRDWGGVEAAVGTHQRCVGKAIILD